MQTGYAAFFMDSAVSREKEFFLRQSGKSGDGGDGVIEVEHFENRIVGTAVFFAKAFVVIEHFLLDGKIVLEHDISAQSDPCFFGRSRRQFDGWMVYQFLVNVFSVAGAKPEPVVGFEAEFEWPYSGFSVHADGGEKLDGIFLQEPDDDFHLVFSCEKFGHKVIAAACGGRSGLFAIRVPHLSLWYSVRFPAARPIP